MFIRHWKQESPNICKKIWFGKNYHLTHQTVLFLDFSAQVTGTILFQILTVKFMEYLTIDSTKSIDLNLF